MWPEGAFGQAALVSDQHCAKAENTGHSKFRDWKKRTILYFEKRWLKNGNKKVVYLYYVMVSRSALMYNLAKK